jgi:hypothetical protein
MILSRSAVAGLWPDITTNVTGGSGMAASVRLCLDNESTGVIAPCKTVSVKIG